MPESRSAAWRAEPSDADLPLADLRASLLDWYAEHRRSLPWRAEAGQPPDPYAVWISEIMLQQTRVETAGPYFERWMKRFPTVEALAAAELEAVLGLWQGLGYYARARNLHAAARQLMREHGGRVPDDPSALRQLPGIGDYSAGAIAAIAFGVVAPAVDGNVRRLLARLAAVEVDPTRGAARRRIRALAGALVDGSDPGDAVQGLIELGARVCRPRRPDCAACPWSGTCRARARGMQAALPVRPARVRQRRARAFAFALRRSGDEARWLVARRHPQGLLGGLWEFPLIDCDDDSEPAELLRAAWGLQLVAWRELPPLEHVFTHIRLELRPILGRVEGRPEDLDSRYAEWGWKRNEALRGDGLPSSTLMDKLVAAVDEALASDDRASCAAGTSSAKADQVSGEGC